MNPSTEGDFTLPDGYVDGAGRCHRQGRMRCAKAGDEIRALEDFRVFLRPAAFLDVILARTLVRLGDLERVDVGIVERLSERDRAMLEGLYRERNGYSRKRSTTRTRSHKRT